MGKKDASSHADVSNKELANKVVDTSSVKWDDTWFLSWLWLNFGAPAPAADYADTQAWEHYTQENDERNNTIQSQGDAQALWQKNTRSKNDGNEWTPRQTSSQTPHDTPAKEDKVFTPSEEFRRAKVISREEVKKTATQQIPTHWPKKTTARSSSNDVDALIAKKAEEVSSEKALRQQRGPVWSAPRFLPWKKRPLWSSNAWFNQANPSRWGNSTPPKWSKTQVVLWKTQSFQQALMQKNTANASKEKAYKVSDSLKKKEHIYLGERITVKEFAEKMWVPLPEVMKVLLANKIIVAAHASIDIDIAMLVAAEFDVIVEKEQAHADVTDIVTWNLQAILQQDKEANDLATRPPVVTVMGHVDHGKTKLLDYLRQTNVIGQEAWGITQSIWASQVEHNGKKLTFIDTPWHELFSSLRARGARITNIVVIVVAADDGVKPQTVEAINHAKDSGVPIIVAITKIDKGLQKMDEIKGQLAEQWLVPEDRGGEIMVIPLSAMTGQWIEDLLDAILLQTEMLELQYSPSRRAVAVVVEANMDAKQWVTTSMIVMTWTLRIWDIIVVHDTYGKVKRMMNRKGELIKEATGGDPVMILGIQDVPEPWRVAEVVDSEKEANKRITLLQDVETGNTKESTYNLMEKISKWDKVQIKLIIKADSFGSLESIKAASFKVPLPENVEIKIIHTDISSITNSDLILAQASDAMVIWYNVQTTAELQKKADNIGVKVKQYDIIYEYMEWLENIASGMIEVQKEEVLIGRLKVLWVFFKRGKEMIIWGKVVSGYIKNGSSFKVWRGDEQISSWHVTSLQKEQESVSEIKEWYECGMKVKVGKKIEVDDELQFFIMQ
jgi:translation initiation factor IF-2